jgi:hypothetical protein
VLPAIDIIRKAEPLVTLLDAGRLNAGGAALGIVCRMAMPPWKVMLVVCEWL